MKIYNKYGVSGDKKLVYRSELTKQYPYPEYDGEKYVGLDYKYNKIGEQYKLRLVNEVFCIVEYMEDGSSKNMLKQYRNNPKGWCFYRLENIKRSNTSIKYRFKSTFKKLVLNNTFRAHYGRKINFNGNFDTW